MAPFFVPCEEKAAPIFKWVTPTGAPQRPELKKIWDNWPQIKI
jgi:hypothetical protein